MTDPVPTHIPLEQWGRDHWSTFAYIDTRCVDFKGIPDPRRMRCDPDLHPHLAHAGSSGPKYPTRLRGGVERHGHDDWSCLDDAEAEGLLENIGTGLHRQYKLTHRGRALVHLLRAHKHQGGGFDTFADTFDAWILAARETPLVAPPEEIMEMDRG